MAKKRPRARLSFADIAANPLSALPALLVMIAKFGLPTVALAVVLWLVLVEMRGDVKGLKVGMSEQAAAMADLVKHLDTERDQSWIVLGVMQRICLNTAKNDADRVACVSATPRR